MSTSLSAVELEAMELGSTVHDADGDALERVEGGWKYNYFAHPVLTTAELISFYSPVTPEWHLQDKHLWDFREIYLNMTDKEQQAVAAIVDEALHRLHNEEGTE